MTDERASPMPPADHDVPTALAIGLVVYVLAKLAHEGIGHGLTCAAVGGSLQGFSSSWAACERAGLSDWSGRAVSAAGTVANLAFGAAFLILLRRGGMRAGATYYFVWLSAAVHLLVGGGYMMVDPIFRFGDWGRFTDGLEASGTWRSAIAVSGAAVSLGTFFALRGPLEQLLGGVSRSRRGQARLLCWLPYFAAGGMALTGAALLNSLGPQYAFTSALATLGGTFLLVWVPVSLPPLPPARASLEGDQERGAARARGYVPRSRGWLGAGGLALAFLVGLLGPGIWL
jgi:hypothetical protein